jgi:tyrosine-protein kinase Etk/Wzc
MCAQLSDFFPTSSDKEKDTPSSFRDTLSYYLYHWPLIALGLLVCFSGAFIYLQKSAPLYDVKATVIINDETKIPEQTALHELNDDTKPNLAESEIEVLKSRYLVNKVVEKLHLWINYYGKTGLKTQDLYAISPVVFKLLDSDINIAGEKFIIKIKDSNSFYLKKSDGTFNEFSFKKGLQNNFGIWELEPTKFLKSYVGKEVIIVISDKASVVTSYQSVIEAILPNKLSPVIEMSLKDNIQQRGEDVLNGIIDYYNKKSAEDKSRANDITLQFIDQRIGAIADQLNHSEKDLENYRSSQGITDITLQSNVSLADAQSNTSKLNDINLEINQINRIEKDLKITQNIQGVSGSLGKDYPSLNNLFETLSKLTSERQKLLATTPESNPIFQEPDRQIASVKGDILSNIENIKSSLVISRSQLQALSSGFKSSIQGLPGQERQVVDKTRQKSIQESLYNYLLQKREELSMSYASTVNNARSVDNAYSTPVKSQKAITLAGAFLMGLLLPIVFLRGRSSLNNRISTRQQIESATGMPLFGEVSHSDSKSPLIINDRTNMLAGEEFRAIRTNLNFLKGKRDKGMTVLVTSSISKEGKSYIASNIGLALAATGKKTIILEVDLRKPKISKTFELSGLEPGMSNYLEGNIKKEHIIQHLSISKNLQIIGAGTIPENPTELLERVEFDELIDWLKESYDFIIIDSPPINLVIDARILSRVSDITLYIIRQAYTFKSLLTFIKSLIKENKLPEMNFIFNSVERVRHGYGYNYDNNYYTNAGDQKKSFKVKEFLKRF